MADRKSLRIEKAPGTTCVRFAWNGGGELPQALQGLYTNPAVAKVAFESWNALQKDRVALEEKTGEKSTKFTA